MKNSTWNPIRRNKNIGTKKSGLSKNNKLVIPKYWDDYYLFWEHIINPVIIPIKINNHKMILFIEPTKQGYVHASTPQDIIRVLHLVKQEHLEEIELIVLRQPKKKEEILKPVWGRFVYYASLGKYAGSAIYLESMSINELIKYSNKLTPFDKKELDLLEKERHRIKKVKKGYHIYTTPEAVRNTQLFRTLPHEIGHAVDYITTKYHSKPTRDKEEYANRYAREFYLKWAIRKRLPFERLYNEKDLENMELNPEWFNFI